MRESLEELQRGKNGTRRRKVGRGGEGRGGYRRGEERKGRIRQGFKSFIESAAELKLLNLARLSN